VDIDEQPTIEAEPVKRGRWEKHDNLMGEYYHCSVCDTRTEVATCMGDPIFVYCPYCGARMKSNEQEEKHEHRKESKRT
jgi:transcription initiation factor IIE alpha subunit